jgi:hypothetical protein
MREQDRLERWLRCGRVARATVREHPHAHSIDLEARVFNGDRQTVERSIVANEDEATTGLQDSEKLVKDLLARQLAVPFEAAKCVRRVTQDEIERLASESRQDIGRVAMDHANVVADRRARRLVSRHAALQQRGRDRSGRVVARRRPSRQRLRRVRRRPPVDVELCVIEDVAISERVAFERPSNRRRLAGLARASLLQSQPMRRASPDDRSVHKRDRYSLVSHLAAPRGVRSDPMLPLTRDPGDPTAGVRQCREAVFVR